MANQLASSSSSSTLPWRHDVFLSFRGEDTRFTITELLHNALSNKGINTYMDQQLQRGEEIAPALFKAIEESRISIVILSKNYATSRWCLDELVKIIQCRESKKQIVLPIFYKVNPSNVRNQTGSYGDACTEHESKFEDNKEKVLMWRRALTEVANLSGHHFRKGESRVTLIRNIVENILVKVLDGTYLNVAKYPVGIDSRVQEVKELLGVGGNDCCVVGIWGTPGIGKTTIAKAVHKAIAHEFEGSCFLADVGERSTSHGDVIQLQSYLLSKVLCGTEIKIDNVYQGISFIEKLLRGKKVLLILDDVHELEQLNNLVEIHQLGEGSRVIITTKNKGLLESCKVELIYEVQKLEDNEALELFSWNAFGKEKPPYDYLVLARRAIAYAQGLPLALNLIGSHLRSKNIDRWQDMLDSYDEGPYRGIQRVLRNSYDNLDYVLQQVFLDIACFFKGEDKDKVLQILKGSNLKVHQHCIDVLVENAIITIEHNRILMHDLLEQMGKHIVWEESPTEPGERSRLWHHEDVYRVLTKNKGTNKIKGIVVKLPKPDVIPLNAKSFFEMVNLEIFISRNVHFSGCVEYLPDDLRWIEFGGPGLQDWGSNILQKHILTFNLQSNCHLRHLITFILPNSGIKQLKGFQNSANLTSMNLSYCEFLEKIPNLSESPNLRQLILNGCKRLVEVDDSVGFLDKLVRLDLGGCSMLTRFVTRLRLRSLQSLYLNGCTRLKTFPKIEDKMESLWSLNIEESGIRELPSSIANLTWLGFLCVNKCENLTGASLHHIDVLQHLWRIEMKECPKLMTFGKFSTHLDTSHDNGIPLAIPNVSGLGGCNLSKSNFLVPHHCWATLLWLDLSKNNFVSLPKCISKFVSLDTLILDNCKRLREIAYALPPELVCLFLRNCKRLREIAVALPPNLGVLLLKGCTSLEKIPKLPSGLNHLDLTNCFRLSGDEVAKLENNLLNLNQESLLCSKLQVTYPGDEVPKPYAIRIESVREDPRQEAYVGGREFTFEIPLNLQERETLIGLAVSCVLQPPCVGCILIPIQVNEARESERFFACSNRSKPAHVSLISVNLEKNQGDICKVIFQFPRDTGIKICGVHPFFRKEDERLPLCLGRTSSLGSSDIIDDEHDRLQQWPSLSSDIEEEQEQPSTISDLLGAWVSACVGCLNFLCNPRK